MLICGRSLPPARDDGVGLGPASGVYTTGQVQAMTGASFRQLDYWRTLGLIPGQYSSPTRRGPGTGRRVLWNDEQVDFVRRLLKVLPGNHARHILKAADAVRRGVCPSCEQPLPEDMR